MPKYPETQQRITRLLTEAGFRNDDGTFDKKGFREAVGISPHTINNYIDGKTSVSLERLKMYCEILSVNLSTIF
jgi:DNA-binding XRE family transcriptional regulator